MTIRLLSAIPPGVDVDLSAPDGIRLISWSSREYKYTYEIWASTKLGPYHVWRRKIFRAQYVRGPGRPHWKKLSSHATWPQALEAEIEARKACTWNGLPRFFVIRYLHETLERMVFKEGKKCK